MAQKPRAVATAQARNTAIWLRQSLSATDKLRQRETSALASYTSLVPHYTTRAETARRGPKDGWHTGTGNYLPHKYCPNALLGSTSTSLDAMVRHGLVQSPKLRHVEVNGQIAHRVFLDAW